MRVAFVQAGAVHSRDAAPARRLRRVAGLLAGRGHDVTVCCARWWDGDHPTFERDGVTYRAVSGESGDWFATRLPAGLRTCRPDVIHAASDPERVLAARVGASVCRAPLLVDWYGARSVDRSDSVERLAARTPATICTPSRHVRTQVRELGVDGDAIRVIPESIDFDRVRGTDPAGDADVIYSRRLDADANLESLLLSLAELRHRDWTATVVGDGPERERYERQARDLRIDDRVAFVGELPEGERVARFKRAHVFVQTARRCPFARELLWALACGCVGVVDYQIDSAAHELVERYDRGFRTTDEEELTDAIAAAAELPRRETDESLERFDHDVVIERYLECYRDLLGSDERSA